MRCQFCSAPLPKSGLVCEYCGKRNNINLNSISYEEREFLKNIYCPVCGNLLKRIDIGRVEKLQAYGCLKCDGIFFKKDILQKVLEGYAKKISVIDINVLNFILNNPRYEREKKVIYKKCPFCKKVMQRKNYKSVSGVIVDICQEHGIWLDGGELKQLLEWKKAGGEIKAKEYEIRPSFKSSDNFEFLKEDKNSFFDFDLLDSFFRWIYGF